jgi:hypothetical protein
VTRSGSDGEVQPERASQRATDPRIRRGAGAAGFGAVAAARTLLDSRLRRDSSGRALASDHGPPKVVARPSRSAIGTDAIRSRVALRLLGAVGPESVCSRSTHGVAAQVTFHLDPGRHLTVYLPERDPGHDDTSVDGLVHEDGELPGRGSNLPDPGVAVAGLNNGEHQARRGQSGHGLRDARRS